MIVEQLRLEVDRRLDEGAGRIERCLSTLSQDEVWRKPGSHLVSVGNLVNHLCGNLGQWVLLTLGGEDIVRERDQEFTQMTGESPSILASKLRTTIERARSTVAELSDVDFAQTYTVQGFNESGVGILLHVVEHFSYHVGQITFYVKQIRNADVGYYRDADLDVP